MKQAYLELLAAWGDEPLDEKEVKKILGGILEEGYADCKKDMHAHLFWLAGMLDKTSDYISDNLLEKQ